MILHICKNHLKVNSVHGILSLSRNVSNGWPYPWFCSSLDCLLNPHSLHRFWVYSKEVKCTASYILRERPCSREETTWLLYSSSGAINNVLQGFINCYLPSTVEQVKQVFKRKEQSKHFNWGVIGENDKEEEGEDGKEGKMKTSAN